MRVKIIMAFFILSHCFSVAQISNAYVAGIYDVNITEWSCSKPTNTYSGYLYLEVNPWDNCLIAKDSSYAKDRYFVSWISFSVTPSDSIIHGCSWYGLAAGKYFQADSLHLYLHFTYSNPCAHEYFGKRKIFTGIDDLKLLSTLISISPQPSYNLLRISNPNNVIEKIPVLFDINGREMNLNFVKNAEGGFNADVSLLPVGIFFLNIQTMAGMIRKKVIISN